MRLNLPKAMLSAGMLAAGLIVECGAAPASSELWQDFADRMLYFGSDCEYVMPGRLKEQKTLAYALQTPDNRKSISTIESFLQQMMENSRAQMTAWLARIPLNKDPRCVLGWYLSEKFAGTLLGTKAGQWFNEAVERASLKSYGGKQDWRQAVEGAIEGDSENMAADYRLGGFETAEVPFVFLYFCRNGSGERIRRLAGLRLAGYLEEEYGLEPAARQYRLVLQRCGNFGQRRQLEAARLFEQTGAVTEAAELYEQVFEAASSSDTANLAAVGLFKIGIKNQEKHRAWAILNRFKTRFPEANLCDAQSAGFYRDYPNERAKTAERIICELKTAKDEQQCLKLCRVWEGLWDDDESLMRWQELAGNLEQESAGWEFAELHISDRLIKSGKFDQARQLLNERACSKRPVVRRQALLRAAEAQLLEKRFPEGASLYERSLRETPGEVEEIYKEADFSRIDWSRLTQEQTDFFSQLLAGFCRFAREDYKGAVQNLTAAERAWKDQPATIWLKQAEKTLLQMLMVCYQQTGDPAKAEHYGSKVIHNFSRCYDEAKQFPDIVFLIERVDGAILKLNRAIRQQPDWHSERAIRQYAGTIYGTMAGKERTSGQSQTTKGRLVEWFEQVRKNRIAQLLAEEYAGATAKSARTGDEDTARFESIIFASAMLRADSFEQICDILKRESCGANGSSQMYRFAKFANSVRNFQLARAALDLAVEQNQNCANTAMLEDIADMYAAGNSHTRAVEIYKKIAEEANDVNCAARAHLKVIRIYAEQLKFYDNAITECRQFLKKFPHCSTAGEVEFLSGKLAYLNGDYAGAVGQLDLFREKYPADEHTAEAILTAGLSRMTQGEIDDAVARFAEVIRLYPACEMAAQSKFLIGYAQVTGQKYADAIETFRQLVEQFPRCRYVERAQSMIERLSKLQQ